ncbi:spore coat protein [Brevibacillus sp. B_LB10_24]|uniref:spore coat protein n=1 Tax=Brevibacillus sp. B_LB10_24 TaxID=3380645 RepID=UPI0038B8BD80
MQQQFGAHEIMELHEVLNASIDAINLGQVYLPYVRDPELRQIISNQMQFMTAEYNNLIYHINGRGGGQAIPYRTPLSTPGQYGVQNANPVQPLNSPEQMGDRDVASAFLGLHKTGAVMKMHAALECADPEVRAAMLQGANNCAHQAYEIWSYMNRRGYYQIPVLQEMAQTNMLRGYQPMNQAMPPHLQPPSGPVEAGQSSPPESTVTSSVGTNQGASANASQIFSSPAYRKQQTMTGSASNPNLTMGGSGQSPLHSLTDQHESEHKADPLM